MASSIARFAASFERASSPSRRPLMSSTRDINWEGNTPAHARRPQSLFRSGRNSPSGISSESTFAALQGEKRLGSGRVLANRFSVFLEGGPRWARAERAAGVGPEAGMRPLGALYLYGFSNLSKTPALVQSSENSRFSSRRITGRCSALSLTTLPRICICSPCYQLWALTASMLADTSLPRGSDADLAIAGTLSERFRQVVAFPL